MATISRLLVILFIAISITHLPGCSEDPPTDTDNNGNPHDSDTVVVTKPSSTLTSKSGMNWHINTAPTLLYDTLTHRVDLNIELDSPLYKGKPSVFTFDYPLEELALGKYILEPQPTYVTSFLIRYDTVFMWYWYGDSRESFEITAIDKATKKISLKLSCPMFAHFNKDTQLVTLELKDISYDVVPTGMPRLEMNVRDSLFQPTSTTGMQPGELFRIDHMVNSNDFHIRYFQDAVQSVRRSNFDVLFTATESGVGTYIAGNYSNPLPPGATAAYMYLYHRAVNPNLYDLPFFTRTSRPSTFKITRFDKIRREMDCEFEGEMYDDYYRQWVPVKMKITNKRWFWYL